MSAKEKCRPMTFEFVPPFDDADADLIIRTSDAAHFRVFKLILRKASSVFADMFTMPQADADGTEVPIVDLTEDKQTILALLHLCYPIGPPPIIDTLDDLCALMSTCEKYDARGPKATLDLIYSRHLLDEDPLRVYAAAVHAKSKAIAKDAALRCLNKSSLYPITADVPSLRSISGTSYQYLLKYLHECRKAAATVLTCSNFSWTNLKRYCWAICTNDKCLTAAKFVTDVNGRVRVKLWWVEISEAIAGSLMTEPGPAASILRVQVSQAPPRPDMCDNCNNRYKSDLSRFLPKMTEQIEKAVEAVEFSLVD